MSIAVLAVPIRLPVAVSVVWKRKLVGTLAPGAMRHDRAVSTPALMIVARAVAVAPTRTDRLLGRTAATIFGPGGGVANVAVTAVSAPSVTWHGAVPLQPPPLQPMNRASNAEVAVSVTTCPPANGADVSGHRKPQSTPGGLLATLPWTGP